MNASPKTESTDHLQSLMLQVNPPRVPRNLVARERLLSSAPAWRDHAAFVVQAPAGFGKTSLLAQWRREFLLRGVIVAWLSARAGDEPRRFVQALALSVGVAAGRPAFGRDLLEGKAGSGIEQITMFLAELTRTALNVVLVIDEADRLPIASREALAYLLRNTPVNLRTVIAARADCQLGVDDLVDYGKCAQIGTEVLRFRLKETLELAHKGFSLQADFDTVARLHELTEGWPLGLQLALTVLGNAADPGTELSALSSHGGRLREHLVSRLLGNLSPVDLDFLTRIAILETLNPALCHEIGGVKDAQERLDRIGQETPILTHGEDRQWLRMHALARTALLQRFADLPQKVQRQTHALAAQRLIEQGRGDRAVWHALESGQNELAYDLAERSLYGFVTDIMSQGRVGIMVEWISLLPPEALDRRPRLLLGLAWVMALSQREQEAQALVAQLLARPGVDDQVRCECALILSGAALFVDDPDQALALHMPWSTNPPLRDPMLRQIHLHRSAFCTLLAGDPAQARLRLQQSTRLGLGSLPGYMDLWGEFHIAMTHIWELQLAPAERLLRSILTRAEPTLGRRNAFVCQVASMLAAVVWELNANEESAALLANRLDVIEQTALPGCLLLAYRTLASIEAARGAEDRALILLEALHAASTVRDLPRLRIASLCDQLRLHAGHERDQTCQELLARIEAEIASVGSRYGPIWHRMVAPSQVLASAYAALAARNWMLTSELLNRAKLLARELRVGRLHIEALALQAYATMQCARAASEVGDTAGATAQAMAGERQLHEARDLAAAQGLRRIFDDAHPALGIRMRQPVARSEQTRAPLNATAHEPTHELASETGPAIVGAALTPREREVLTLLARSLSNKEIGVAMQVGEDTVKWHVKNLFYKLSAGSRKHVVLRARVLGLLPPGD